MSGKTYREDCDDKPLSAAQLATLMEITREWRLVTKDLRAMTLTCLAKAGLIETRWDDARHMVRLTKRGKVRRARLLSARERL